MQCFPWQGFALICCRSLTLADAALCQTSTSSNKNLLKFIDIIIHWKKPPNPPRYSLNLLAGWSPRWLPALATLSGPSPSVSQAASTPPPTSAAYKPPLPGSCADGAEQTKTYTSCWWQKADFSPADPAPALPERSPPQCWVGQPNPTQRQSLSCSNTQPSHAWKP